MYSPELLEPAGSDFLDLYQMPLRLVMLYILRAVDRNVADIDAIIL